MSAVAATPSNKWYIAHAILGIVSGLVVYCLYRNRDKVAALVHVLHSVVITVLWIVTGVLIDLLFIGVLNLPVCPPDSYQPLFLW